MALAPVHQVATTCPYCGVGCGVLVDVGSDGTVNLSGDPDHPANLGRLCSKGAALGETLDLDGRLLHPEINGGQVDWDTALDAVADGFGRIIRDHGPDAVAFYVSGQLLTEDYYVANKLMKGFIGSANIDTNSRLCMSSAVAGYKRSFGSDTVPCSYTDLEEADLLVLTGSNTAWCHPVLFQRIRAAKSRRKHTKIVVIDPRRTPTCDIADLHLPLRPGTDAVLFNGLLNYLRRDDVLDWDFLEAHTEGFSGAMKAAKASADNIPEVAHACGLNPDDVGRFFRLFARTEKTVTLFSQGINQSSSGTDKVNAIINCHLATGRIGKPGAGPFSITGQPNAMGGREVGGLATMLAAHMDFQPESLERVAQFWDSPGIATQPGPKAVDLFRAIGDGRIKAVWIMATNPVVSLPDADAMHTALEQCELVVVSDCVRRTDTTACANILLPAAAWGEKEGTVTNSERRISRQRAFLDAPGAARPDWWIVSQVAQRLGHREAFPYTSAATIFREHARLSGLENGGTRDFDISALAAISDAEYHDLTPIQWPITPINPMGTRRMFEDGRFFTPTGKACLVAVEPRPPGNLPDVDFPLVLNTGRVRDQWHTMTRTGKAARLCAHSPEPTVDIHPDDAKRHHLRAGGLAKITSRWGKVIVRVRITGDVPPGSVFVPLHWNNQFASCARVDAVANPVTDPISGEPEFKHTPVAVEAYTPSWHGFALSRHPLDLSWAEFWVSSKGTAFWRYEFAGEEPPMSWSAWGRDTLANGGEWLEFEDRGSRRYRGAEIAEGRLQSCVFTAASVDLPPRTWLGSLFDKERLEDSERMSLLVGRPTNNSMDVGPTVCSCFGVGRNTLVEAIVSRRLTTVDEIGAACQAGTNCGSCVPELHALLEEMDDRPQSGSQQN